MTQPTWMKAQDRLENSRAWVFVYGTLRGDGSQRFRMAGAEFIGSGTVRGRLYRIDWYPGLVLDAEGGDVCGEVFAVTLEQLAALDEFEGGEYRRVRMTVRGEGSPMDAWGWEWLGPVDEAQRIVGGDWLSPPDV